MASGTERKIRAIVYREGDFYVAQCLEYDIAAQAGDIEEVLDRLDLTIDAEFQACDELGKTIEDSLCKAPTYYHSLWDKATLKIMRVDMAAPSPRARVEAQFAKAA